MATMAPSVTADLIHLDLICWHILSYHPRRSPPRSGMNRLSSDNIHMPPGIDSPNLIAAHDPRRARSYTPHPAWWHAELLALTGTLTLPALMLYPYLPRSGFLARLAVEGSSL